MAKRKPSMTGAEMGARAMGQGFSRRWPPPQIEVLAEQLEKDTGCTIDREVFQDDMVHWDAYYWAMKLREQESTAEAHAAMERAFRQCQEFRSSLQKAIEAAAPLYDLEAMLADIQHMERRITWQTEAAREIREKMQPPRSAGRPEADLFEGMISSLASIYELHTGRFAGTSTSRSRDGRGGAFVRFVKSVLDVVEPGDRRRALGESVAKMLRVLKENQWVSREYLRWARAFPSDARALNDRRRGKQLGR